MHTHLSTIMPTIDSIDIGARVVITLLTGGRVKNINLNHGKSEIDIRKGPKVQQLQCAFAGLCAVSRAIGVTPRLAPDDYMLTVALDDALSESFLDMGDFSIAAALYSMEPFDPISYEFFIEHSQAACSDNYKLFDIDLVWGAILTIAWILDVHGHLSNEDAHAAMADLWTEIRNGSLRYLSLGHS